MGLFADIAKDMPEVSPQEEVALQEELSTRLPEVERGAFANFGVALESNFYKILDLAGTSTKKFADWADTPGMGWVSKHAGNLALAAKTAQEAPELQPETDPEGLDMFAELIGSSVPYMATILASYGAGAAAGGGAAGLAGASASTVGTAATTGGILASGATSFAINREESFRYAKETGATDDEANLEANIVGGVVSLLEVAQVGRVLKFSKTGGALYKAIVMNARNKAWSNVAKAGGKLSMSMVRTAVEEAIEESLQGTASEGIPALLRGLKIEGGAEGFLKRRGTEAALGGIVGGMFGTLGALGTAAFSKGDVHIPGRPEVEREGDPTLDLSPPELEQEMEQPDVMETEGGTLGDFDQESFEEAADPIMTGDEIAPSSPETKVGQETKEVVEEEVLTPTQKLKNIISEKRTEFSESRAVAKKAQSKERGIRAAQYEKALAEESDVDVARKKALSELKGELPKASFTGIDSEQMTNEDWRNVRNEVRDSDLKTFEKEKAFTALDNLMNALVPTESDLKSLNKVVFGFEFLLKATDGRLKKMAIGMLMEITNFGKTVLASGDISPIGRQGLTKGVRYPKHWFKAFVDSHKAYFSKERTSLMQKEMYTSPAYDLARTIDRSEMLTDIDGELSKREAEFYSNWAKRIPILGGLIKASERAAVVGMNRLRMGVFQKYVNEWEGTGKSEQDLKDLADFMLQSTGRGSGKFLKDHGHLLSAGFFSPRFVISRFQLIGSLGLTTAPVRKLVAQELLTFVGSGILIMTMASMLGADVEEDPRSSDFGKIKVGKTRYDVWGGYAQIARTTAQMITKERKSVRSGEISGVERDNVLGRFLRGKLSPPAGLAIDALKNETFMGEKLSDKVKTVPGAIDEVVKRTVPLFAQDIEEAAQYSGFWSSVATAPLAFYGIGVQSYEPSRNDQLKQMRDQYAGEVYGADWDQISGESQQLLREYRPKLQELEQEVKANRTDFDFVATLLKEQAEAGERVKKELPTTVQKELKSLNMDVGGLSRTLARNWRLNSKRYDQYQKDTASILKKVLPRVIESPAYQKLPPQAKRTILDELILEAKKAARDNVVATAKMKDFERLQRTRQ